MSQERVIFASAFEALGRLLQETRPELYAELKASGLDFEHLQTAYPIARWKQATGRVAQVVFPNLTTEIAEYQLGQLVMVHYENTFVGKALMAMLRVLGPARSLGRVSRSFRNANNYIQDRVVRLGDKHFELWLNELDVPYFNQGIVQKALEMTGAKSCRVDIVRRDVEGVTFDITWE